jgi:G2/mitotic-specific cyclin 1/2
MFSWLYRTETPRHQAGTRSGIASASNAAISPEKYSADSMALVIEEMDLKTAMKARAVCKSWRTVVKEAGLEPLEAGCTMQQVVLGLESQKRLEQALTQENEVYTPAYTAKLTEYLAKQTEITAKMRHNLVNWLIEIHFKFKRHNEASLYLSIKLVDLFLAYNEVTSEIFQNVGVSAFRLACMREEKSYPNIFDLSHITAGSSTKDQIIEMQEKIFKQFEDNLEHPNPANYLDRFSKAAKLNFTKSSDTKYSKDYSTALYFIDIALLDATLVTTRPSLIAAAGVMCTLRVLGRSDWNKQLDHYTTYTREAVAALASQLIANGRVSTPSAIQLKYTSERLGGKGDQVGADGKTLNDGCLHILAGYYKLL